MAAAAVLQSPTYNSFTMSSPPPEISQARQRRRRTVRKSEGSKKQSIQDTEHTHLSLDQYSVAPPGAFDNASVDFVGSSVPDSTVESLASVSTASPLAETARNRRRTRLRKQFAQNSESETLRPQSARARPLPELEDSTARVTSLLKEKLQSENGDILRSQESEPRALVTTEEEREHNAATEEQSEQPLPGRPLPELVPVDDERSVELCTDILGVTIHKTDHLKASVKISHPCVRVSVVDVEERGNLLKKSQPDRCVTSFYERGNPNVDYILPVITQPYYCKDNSNSLQPVWEETIVFNEQLTHFTNNENVIIFFELLDFSTTSSTNVSRKRAVASSELTPWYQIAWGFLKPSGKISKSMMGQRNRVQLYKFPKRKLGSSTEIYELWSRYNRTPYPSTLYVTLKALPQESSTGELDHTQQVHGRSVDPTLAEVGSQTFEQLAHKQQHTKSLSSLTAQPSALLSETVRLPGQLCRSPTTPLTTLHLTKNGCSVLKFSHSGRFLAAGCADDNEEYPVIIFEVPSFEPVLVTEGHKGIVYDMCWSANDSYLTTASGDSLVKVWLMSSSSPEPVFVLPHPCYVYSVCFISESLVFTGAYDSNIRLWSLPPEPPTSPQLVYELRGQTGLVNTLLWCRGGLYAGDSQGEVGVWREEQGEWQLSKKITVFKSCAITAMSSHPNGRKLLLQSSRGSVVMLDLRMDRVCCEYGDTRLSQSQRCSSLVSPCGELVLASGAPGQLHVWNSATGKPVFSYKQELPFKSTVSAVAFHPSEQMAVFAAYGLHEPIVVLVHKNDPSDLTVPATEATHTTQNIRKKRTSKDTAEKTLKVSTRFRDIARTLNTVTAFTSSSQ